MSSEFSRDKNAMPTAGSGVQASDRRASGTVGGSNPEERRAGVRRQEQHPVQMAVFGGVRSTDRPMLAAPKEGVRPWVVWFAFISLVLVSWPVYMGWVIKPGTGLGYYFGLVGGVMMLLMLLYPVRKHMSWARTWGPVRYWFMVHMIFGIGGPVLVIFHSTFHVKSLNAAVAFYSMLLVASSGVIGRFIYKRIHQGLYGRRTNLEELQQAVDSSKNKMSQINAILFDATGVGEKLEQFRNKAMSHTGMLPVRAWIFMTLGLRRRFLTNQFSRKLKRAIAHLGKSQGWDKQHQTERYQAVSQDVEEYLSAIQSAAQFSAYERLFRLWHVLHSPFVWSLGASGIVHVIATQFMY
jgi:hypothetical protein